MAVKIGYECEFFLRDAKDDIVYDVPYDLPHDAAGTLVEARSAAHEDPAQVKTSFLWSVTALRLAALNHGFTLHHIDRHVYPIDKPHSFRGAAETAGFHVHFSAYGVPRDVIIAEFDTAFADVVRHQAPSGDKIRIKSYGGMSAIAGFEYRMLPATVDVERLTSWIATRIGAWS